MNIADELTKLNELRFSGALTDAEFEKAKAALLNPPPAEPAHMTEELAQLRYETDLARIDREWETERQRYYIRNHYGVRQVPTAGVGIAAAVVGGGFGILWTILAIVITSAAPNNGPFTIVKIVFPLFGVFFTVFGIAMGTHVIRKSRQYQEQLQAYQERRASIRPDHSR